MSEQKPGELVTDLDREHMKRQTAEAVRKIEERYASLQADRAEVLQNMREVKHPMMDSFTKDNLRVFAGEPGAGGASHRYLILHQEGPPDFNFDKVVLEINLQHGPLKEVGVNGIGNGTLLLIVWDFLKSLQDGDYKTRENAVAVTKIEEGMQWQKQRELDRAERGVLGTWQK